MSKRNGRGKRTRLGPAPKKAKAIQKAVDTMKMKQQIAATCKVFQHLGLRKVCEAVLIESMYREIVGQVGNSDQVIIEMILEHLEAPLPGPTSEPTAPASDAAESTQTDESPTETG